MAKSTKGSIGSYSRGKLEKIIDDRVDTSAAGSAFTTIAVSGQSNVVSDGATDTLTLVAGSNMTITTSAAGDSITFASSGGGGGGDTAITGTLDVTGASSLQGSLEVIGETTLDGDINLGNATGDTITATGRFDSDLVPSSDSTRDLGTSALQWAEAHIDHGYIDAITATGTSTLTTVDINGGNIDGTVIGANSAAAGTFAAIAGTTGTFSSNVAVTGTLNVTGDVTLNGDLIPDSTSNGAATKDLGSSANQWKDLYIDGTAHLDEVDIDAGAIDGAVIGANSAAAGTFTAIAGTSAAVSGTLDVTGATSLQGAVEVVGAADLASTLIVAGATTLNGKFTGSNGFDLQDGGSSLIKGDDTNGIVFGSNWTAASKTCANLGTVTTADIDGGSIDGTVIGANSAAAGTFAAIAGTTGTFSSNVAVTGTLNVTGDSTFNGSLIPDSTENGAATKDLGSSANQWRHLYVDGVAHLDEVDIDAGAIDGTVIGANSAANGTFAAIAGTTGTFSSNVAVTGTLNVTGDVTLNGDLIPDSTENGAATKDLGSSANQWKDLYIDGTAHLDAVDIDGGNIDGTAIGANSAAAGTFTAIVGTSAAVSGTLDVTGNTSLQGTLEVVGDTTLNGAVNLGNAASDITTVVGKLTASNGLSVTGDVGFDNASFTGDVTLGNAVTDVTTVTGQLTASNGIVTTAATVTDGLTVSAGTTAVQALTATTISGSSTLQVGGTADFDGNVTMDNDLAVAGTTTVVAITASNGATITGSLRVKDEAEFASELSGTIIRATAIYLNDDAITAGVNTGGDNTWTGTNIFSSKLTASNGMMITNHLLADNGTVTISGQLTASSGATITGSARFASEVEMADTLDVTGNTTIAGTLSAGVTNVTTLTASNGIAITGSLRVNDEAEFAGPVDINSGYIDGVYLGTSTAIPQLTASSLLVDGDFQVNASAKISSLAQDLNVNGYNVTNVSQLDVDGNFDFDGDLDADVDNWNVTATTSWSTTLNGSMTDPQAYFKDGDGTTVLAVNPLPNPGARGLNLYAATKAYFGINGMNQSGSIGCEDDKTQLIISGTNGIDVSGSTNFADSVFISGTLDISEFDNQPDTPDADKIKVFARTGSLFIINDLGETTKIGSGTGGGGGGSTSPGGSDTQIQFNDGGSFAGDSGLTYNKTTDTLSVTNLTSSNGISVSGSFKVNDRVEIGGYLGVGVSEEEVTHGITLPNSSGVDGSAKANAFITYSSIRYKSDVKEIQDPLGKIAQLRGVTYNWKDSGKSDVGLIAEEVSKVMPEIVSFEPNGKDAFGIDYSKLTSLLLASVKAQQSMIETQNKKIEELENKLKKIID